MITVDPHGNLDRAAVLREIDRLQLLARDLRGLLDGTPPDLHDDAPAIDHWQLALRQEPCLAGFVSGHPLGIGGTDRMTVTSGLCILDARRGCARILGRLYHLGPARPGSKH